jgi:hypothetical protein
MGKTGNLVDGGGTGVSPVEEEATGRTRIPHADSAWKDRRDAGPTYPLVTWLTKLLSTRPSHKKKIHQHQRREWACVCHYLAERPR